jgi:hypothetical protein
VGVADLPGYLVDDVLVALGAVVVGAYAVRRQGALYPVLHRVVLISERPCDECGADVLIQDHRVELVALDGV